MAIVQYIVAKINPLPIDGMNVRHVCVTLGPAQRYRTRLECYHLPNKEDEPHTADGGLATVVSGGIATWWSGVNASL